MMYKTATVLIGIFVAVMISFNGALAAYTSSMFAVLLIHASGLLMVSMIVLLKKENTYTGGKIPVYLFCAGVIGVVLTYLNNECVGALGVSLTLALGLLGQTVLSCIIDHFGLFGVKINKFSNKKLIGFASIIIGAAIMALY